MKNWIKNNKVIAFIVAYFILFGVLAVYSSKTGDTWPIYLLAVIALSAIGFWLTKVFKKK